MLYKVYPLLKKYYIKSSFFGHKRAASHHYNIKHIFISWAAAASLTQCPYEIVLRPQTEHRQVEVENAQVKRLGVDVWVVNDAIHRTYAIEGKVDQQAKSTSAQLHQYISLKQQVSPVSLGTNLSEILIISWQDLCIQVFSGTWQAQFFLINLLTDIVECRLSFCYKWTECHSVMN